VERKNRKVREGGREFKNFGGKVRALKNLCIEGKEKERLDSDAWEKKRGTKGPEIPGGKRREN